MESDSAPIEVVIVDDQPLLRDGTTAYLAHYSDISVIGTTGRGIEALGLVAKHQPDVLILDLHLPDLSGVEVAQRVRADFPRVKILVLTGQDDVDQTQVLRSLGVQGCLSTSASGDDLVAAVRAVAAGRTGIETEAIPATISRGIGSLARRELVVLHLLAKGRRNAEIATELNRTEKTVEYHVSHILAKLGARSRVDLIVMARDGGFDIVDPPGPTIGGYP